MTDDRFPGMTEVLAERDPLTLERDPPVMRGDPRAPTGRRLLLLKALARHWVQKGRAPTYQDLAAEVGWFTRSAVTYNANKLWLAGYVTYEPGESRTLRPTPAGWAASGSQPPTPCPLCGREAAL